MKLKYAERTIIIFVFLFLPILVGLVCAGAQKAYMFIKEKDNVIISLEKEIVGLKYEIEILESCCRWELVFFDVLSSQEKFELEAIEEALKRKRQRAFLEKS